jgi:hypothetical protein
MPSTQSTEKEPRCLVEAHSGALPLVSRVPHKDPNWTYARADINVYWSLTQRQFVNWLEANRVYAKDLFLVCFVKRPDGAYKPFCQMSRESGKKTLR